MSYTAFIEADCIVSSVPGNTKEDAREYLEECVDTGDLGPVQIRQVEEEDDE